MCNIIKEARIKPSHNIFQPFGSKTISTLFLRMKKFKKCFEFEAKTKILT